jgi:hypothetical protein
MIPVRFRWQSLWLAITWIGSGFLVSPGIAAPLGNGRLLADLESAEPSIVGMLPDPDFRPHRTRTGEAPSAGVPDEFDPRTEPPPDTGVRPDGELLHLAGSAPPVSTSSDASLRDRIRSAGRLPVIVRLRSGGGALGTSGAGPNGEATLAAVQERVIERLLRSTASKRDELAIKTFAVTPAVAMHINEQEFLELLGYPEVLDIVEDAVAPPAAP